jgi:hypothetical protein
VIDCEREDLRIHQSRVQLVQVEQFRMLRITRRQAAATGAARPEPKVPDPGQATRRGRGERATAIWLVSGPMARNIAALAVAAVG